MPSTNSTAAAFAATRLHHVIGREPAPRRRSWFYRFFVAPFADMDHREVYRQQQRRR